MLRNTGFVERQVPVTDDPSTSRRGHYVITDPFLRFYYRFLSIYQTQLALGEQQRAQGAIEEHLPAFIEANTWRELCREWLLRASANDALPLTVTDVGSAWRRTHHFDVVGIDKQKQHLIVGCAQWNDEPANTERFADMLERLSALIPKQGRWQIYLMGFAAGGWEEGARERAETLVEEMKKSKHWQPAGIQLVNLDQVDADLIRWGQPAAEE